MKLPHIPVPKNIRIVKTLIVVFGVGLLPNVFAQDPAKSELEQNDSGWGLGIAAISNQMSYTDIDRDTMIIPIITYENEYIRWMGPQLDFKLPGLKISNTQQIDFSISASYDLNGYDKDQAKDTPILNGMDERDGVAMVGAKMMWTNPWVDVGATWMTDISGDRDSSSFSIGFERNWTVGQHLIIGSYAEAIWVSDEYVDYHYGVQSHEARIDRPAYNGESTVNIEFGIKGAYMFDSHHSVLVDFSLTSLGDEIKDSPLVDSSTENNMMFIYLYRF